MLSKGKQRDYGEKHIGALSPKYIMISRFCDESSGFYDENCEQWLKGIKSWESRHCRLRDWGVRGGLEAEGGG